MKPARRRFVNPVDMVHFSNRFLYLRKTEVITLGKLRKIASIWIELYEDYLPGSNYLALILKYKVQKGSKVFMSVGYGNALVIRSAVHGQYIRMAGGNRDKI
jgi:hypothetical protein